MRKRKWLKGIAITLLVLILGVGLTGLILYQRASRVPEWYAAAKEPMPDDKDLENKTSLPLHNWVNKTSAGDVDAKPADAKRYTIELTSAQINALLNKWTDAAGIRDNVERQVKGIRVRITDGKITIAGELVEQQVVASVVLQPKHDAAGYSQLMIDSIRIGDAPVLMMMLSKQQGALNGSLARRFEAGRDKIAIDEHGIATPETVNLFYLNMLAKLFSGRDADAYTFIGRGKTYFPSADDPVATRIRDIKVSENKLTLTLEMLDAAQRQALVDTLKKTEIAK